MFIAAYASALLSKGAHRTSQSNGASPAEPAAAAAAEVAISDPSACEPPAAQDGASASGAGLEPATTPSQCDGQASPSPLPTPSPGPPISGSRPADEAPFLSQGDVYRLLKRLHGDLGVSAASSTRIRRKLMVRVSVANFNHFFYL